MSNSASKSKRPTKCNVLFTCAGRRVALLRAFREALAGLGLSGRLHATDITSAAPAWHEADQGHIVPKAASPKYVDMLLEIVKSHAIDLLVPLIDLDLLKLSNRRDEFAERGCTAMISSPAVVSLCRNKLRFGEEVSRAGLAGIRTVSLAEFRAQSFYPCFVKPIGGSAGIGTAVLKDAGDLARHVALHGEELLIQEYLAGQEYTIDVYRRRDGEICSIVPRQRLNIRSGEVDKGITVKDAQLIDCARRLVENLPGLWGVVNMQCRRAPGGEPRFFELNPRFGGGAPLSIAAGVNLPKMLLSEVTGQPPEPRVGQFTDRLLMLRYDDAIFTRADNPESLPGFGQPTTK